MKDAPTQARSFLANEHLSFNDADALWKQLKKQDDLSLARRVLSRVRDGNGLLDGLPPDKETRDELCRQEALLTSKDQELPANKRHKDALTILEERFVLGDDKLNGDEETLGIAGGILKRQWEDLGQYEDLRRAAEYYRRGAAGPIQRPDAYAHINAAFLEDLLASIGDHTEKRRQAADDLRKHVVAHIPETVSDWWSAASRAEALLGLGRYPEATETIRQARQASQIELWQLQTTTQQMARLAYLRQGQPLRVPEIQVLFKALLPGPGAAVPSFIGKVGLALSGGGFRASFYHLGVLARLAELDVLRHVEVLSCVSGGSIVGACYWLLLRRLLMDSPVAGPQDYISLVGRLIEHFETAVAFDLRGRVQPSKAAIAFQVLVREQKGAMSPEKTADALDEYFYRPLYGKPGDAQSEPLYMHQLAFTPKDYNSALTGSEEFKPGRHNWLRANKVSALVLNATTVNTGRGWQFTPTWMGESPWALNEDADNIERLQWAWYAPKAGWQVRLARAVAASASVPGVFAPLKLGQWYAEMDVQLVDGGVCDNQGVLSLLAMNCNVLLVSDAAGQLLLERRPVPGIKGLASYAVRAMDILMERVRQGTCADLEVRRMSGLLRGLMFLHMKAGLDRDTIRLPFSQEPFELERSVLSPSGVRQDFQRALAELRTDLDAFSLDESRSLMACGYQMASKAYERDLAHKITELAGQEIKGGWPFAKELRVITSMEEASQERTELLETLRRGKTVVVSKSVWRRISQRLASVLGG